MTYLEGRRRKDSTGDSLHSESPARQPAVLGTMVVISFLSTLYRIRKCYQKYTMFKIIMMISNLNIKFTFGIQAWPRYGPDISTSPFSLIRATSCSIWERKKERHDLHLIHCMIIYAKKHPITTSAETWCGLLNSLWTMIFSTSKDFSVPSSLKMNRDQNRAI